MHSTYCILLNEKAILTLYSYTILKVALKYYLIMSSLPLSYAEILCNF